MTQPVPLVFPPSFGPPSFGPPSFGWYHGPTAARLARGVVLCPPFGAEALYTHRNLRLLASQLAQAGLHVLRFDYPATGDSLGEPSANMLPAWRHAIAEAIALLESLAGSGDIALCGLRLGALLAADAATRHKVSRLALLAPPASGADIVHELALRQRLAATTPRPAWLEASGFALHETDQHHLAGLTLAATLDATLGATLPSLVLAPAAEPAPDPPGATILRFDGYKEFMREAHLAAPPLRDFARVVDFLAAGATAAPPAASAAHPAPAGTAATPPAILHGPGFDETPLFPGPARDLFGIICAAPDTPPGPAAVILNTGSTHHVGDAGAAVLLARRLAAAGIASLRLDLAGIGDAPRDIDPRLLGGGADAWRLARIRLYRQPHIADLRAVLDTLQSQGYGPFTLVGVCSGAVLALNVALADPRVSGLALANLPSFDRVFPHAAMPAATALPLHRRFARAALAPHLRRALTEALRRRAALPRRLAASLGLAHATRPVRILRHLSRRGVQALLLYTAGDSGLAELQAAFGPAARHLGSLPGMACTILDGTDHAFATIALRDALVGHTAGHIARLVANPGRRRHPAPPAWLTGCAPRRDPVY